MEKINIRYLKKEWICGARKIDIGCKSPFVLWQDSNYFQDNEPCLNGGFPGIVYGLVPRGSRQFQRNDHRHGPIVICQSLLGFDPWRPCEMYDLKQKKGHFFIILCWTVLIKSRAQMRNKDLFELWKRCLKGPLKKIFWYMYVYEFMKYKYKICNWLSTTRWSVSTFLHQTTILFNL